MSLGILSFFVYLVCYINFAMFYFLNMIHNVNFVVLFIWFILRAGFFKFNLAQFVSFVPFLVNVADWVNFTYFILLVNLLFKKIKLRLFSAFLKCVIFYNIFF